MKEKASKYLPYLYPIFVFFLLSFIYFIPDVTQGRMLYQGDIVNHKGMSQHIVEHREAYGEEPLWTNSMFGGMPAYLISTQYKNNLLRQVHNIFTLYDYRPVCFIFLYLTGFYIALLLFGFNRWLSFAGAIAYAFSSYFFIIIEAGHVSKVLALGYMPPIIAGVYAAYRGKILTGSIVAALFLGLQIIVNHLQITYYTLLIIMVFMCFEFYKTLKTKEWTSLFKPVPYLFLFVFLAIGANFSTLWTTYEYGKYSIRGKSELTEESGNQTSGLDKDYATQWSYGIGETFTLVIPNIMGGSSNATLDTDSETYNYIRNNYDASVARSFIQNVPLYRGTQPFTSGPVYVGASVFLLFLLGLFIVKGPVKWWLLTATIISIMLSWGSNFSLLTNFMLDYFPAYNKFRAVSMTLIIAEFTIPLLAILALKEILETSIDKKEFMKLFKYSVIGLGGVIAFIYIIAGSFNYAAPTDEQLISQGLGGLAEAIRTDRLMVLRADALRSLIFIAFTAALVYAAYMKKIKMQLAIFIFAGIFLADMWPVNKRYLNSSNFVPAEQAIRPFTASTADLVVLNDKDSNFRVLNISVSTFQDASTSYFHNSIGGYHGAKMKRYQELIDNHIINEITKLVTTLNNSPVSTSIDSTMERLSVINMLNTRYIIYNPEAPPLVNKHEPGHAWFIENVRFVDNADGELAALTDFNPLEEAIVDRRFENLIPKTTYTADSTGYINLMEYRENYLHYSFSSEKEQIVVFSEIYYEKGWEAFIDGNPAPHFRADYVLRAMHIPAGDHTIEFRFNPQSYYTGEKISLASSLLFIIIVAFSIFYPEKFISKTTLPYL